MMRWQAHEAVPDSKCLNGRQRNNATHSQPCRDAYAQYLSILPTCQRTTLVVFLTHLITWVRQMSHRLRHTRDS